MEIVVEPDPAVTLTAPAAVEPGSPIAIETRGSQLRSDGIEIWQGEQQIDWGRTLSELAAGQSLNAPLNRAPMTLSTRAMMLLASGRKRRGSPLRSAPRTLPAAEVRHGRRRLRLVQPQSRAQLLARMERRSIPAMVRHHAPSLTAVPACLSCCLPAGGRTSP
ncbi:hypothetical protein V6L77_22455 [Pannonibacter sp. Pt2-lr]